MWTISQKKFCYKKEIKKYINIIWFWQQKFCEIAQQQFKLLILDQNFFQVKLTIYLENEVGNFMKFLLLQI